MIETFCLSLVLTIYFGCVLVICNPTLHVTEIARSDNAATLQSTSRKDKSE